MWTNPRRHTEQKQTTLAAVTRSVIGGSDVTSPTVSLCVTVCIRNGFHSGQLFFFGCIIRIFSFEKQTNDPITAPHTIKINTDFYKLYKQIKKVSATVNYKSKLK